MATPISRLTLRRLEIPRTPAIALLEREVGRPLLYEHRHFLAGKPVHCGNLLEIYLSGSWEKGRYEWTGQLQDTPALHTSEGIRSLDERALLRWPLIDD